MKFQTHVATAVSAAPMSSWPVSQPMLQRKCAGRGTPGSTGTCGEHARTRRLGLQTKLKVNALGDSYEREADRVADEVMTTKTRTAVSRTQPLIQRHSGQPVGQAETAPQSVERVIASPGVQMDPVFRHEMSQRMGYDFSHVRVHRDDAAARSAHEVNARAYTVGHDIVFGANQFAPDTNNGRRLIAHELTHVIQQGGEARTIQRAPATLSYDKPFGPQLEKSPDSSPNVPKQLSADEWIALLEKFRRESPEQFVKLLGENERFFYPLLQPYGFRGSWTTEKMYLDDFDAAVAKWGKAPSYRVTSPNVPRQRRKSREEEKYDYAHYLVRDMNRHGYGRGKLNDELESSGLMAELVSHGFEKHGT